MPGTAFSYAFPANTFTDADNDALTYTAVRGNNSALPAWLSFNANTRTFSGIPGATDTGTLTVKVTARDGRGGSVSDNFDIDVSTPPLGTPFVNFATRTSDVSEGEGTTDITVNLSPVPQSGFDLSYRVGGTASSSDFTIANSGSVSVASGAGTVQIPVTIIDDSIIENSETITLTLLNGTGYTVGSTGFHTITISDDEPRLNIPTVLTVNEGSSTTYKARLNREPSSAVTVTINGHENLDGFSLNPTQLTFNPGETEQTITVSADEDENMISERIELTHSTTIDGENPKVLVVTVRDNDIPPSEIVEAGLVRFGRAVGEQSASAIRDRLGAPRIAGFQGVFAGHTLTEMTCDEDTPTVQSNNSCLETGSNRASSMQASVEQPDASHGLLLSQGRALSTEEIVVGTSFAVTHRTSTDASVSVWGQGFISGFNGRQGLLNIEGDLTGFMLGWDHSHNDRINGVMLARNSSDIRYGGNSTSGTMDLELTAIIPYAGWTVRDGIEIWGALGFGMGNLVRNEDGADVVGTDISWRMAVLGSSGDLPASQLLAGAELRWSADLLWTQTEADSVEDRLDDLSGKTVRQRLGVESIWEYQLASGPVVRPSLEVGIRHDSGDAETGLGLEVGGGLELSDPERGLSLLIKGRKLIVHKEDDFKDWGLRIGLVYDASPTTRQGFSASVSHDLGNVSRDGLGALIEAERLPDVEEVAENDGWSAEMAYGISQGQGMVGSPYMNAKGSSEVDSTRFGYRIEPDLHLAQNMTVDLWAEPEMSDAGGTESSGNKAGFNLVTRW